MSNTTKRFPANVNLLNKKGEEIKNFLNDSKIDGALYALLLSYSYGDDGVTKIDENRLPSFVTMSKILTKETMGKDEHGNTQIKVKHPTRQTVSTHFNYLLK